MADGSGGGGEGGGAGGGVEGGDGDDDDFADDYGISHIRHSAGQQGCGAVMWHALPACLRACLPPSLQII